MSTWGLQRRDDQTLKETSIDLVGTAEHCLLRRDDQTLKETSIDLVGTAEHCLLRRDDQTLKETSIDLVVICLSCKRVISYETSTLIKDFDKFLSFANFLCIVSCNKSLFLLPQLAI